MRKKLFIKKLLVFIITASLTAGGSGVGASAATLALSLDSAAPESLNVSEASLGAATEGNTPESTDGTVPAAQSEAIGVTSNETPDKTLTEVTGNTSGEPDPTGAALTEAPDTTLTDTASTEASGSASTETASTDKTSTDVTDSKLTETDLTYTASTDATETSSSDATDNLSSDSPTEDTASANTDKPQSDTVSNNTLSDNEIVFGLSENSAAEETEAQEAYEAPDYSEYIEKANTALVKLLKGKLIPAVIVLCDSYSLRSEPREDSGTIVSLPVSTTVYPQEIALTLAKAEDGNSDSSENSSTEVEIWFKVRTYVNEREYTGYVIKDKLIYADADMLDWECEYLSFVNETGTGAEAISTNGLKKSVYGASSAAPADDTESAEERLNKVAKASIESFPATYQNALTSLSTKHSNWVFVPQNVGVSFSAALAGELSDKNKNWIYHTAIDSFKNGLAATNWYYASKACLEYYMDPRNFLTESYIFQFETLNYNPSYQTAAGVQKFLNSTFMSGTIPGESLSYAEAFAKTGAAHQVSPYHLAARVYQEQGVKGTSAIISGTYPGYAGYYNYFNIQASGSNPILNGLIYAKKQGWNTRYKSLDGGAEFLGSTYINRGQDTLYTQKYNVASASSRYTHQYMQNAQAATTESAAIYKIYNGSGSLNDAFIFKIPVYTDMSVPADTGTSGTTTATGVPTVLTKSVKLNAWSNNGTALSILPAVGTSIASVSIKKKDGSDSQTFYITGSGEDWFINLKERATVQKNNKGLSESLILSVTTGDSKTYTSTLSASVECSKPKVTLQSVRAVNVFGKGGTDMGIYRVSTSEKLLDISDPNADTRSSSSQPFIVLDHTYGNLAYLKAVNVTTSNISKVARNVSLYITLDGYDPVEYTFNASTRNVKPTIKVKAAIIYGTLSYGTAYLTDASGKALKLPSDAKVTTTAGDVDASLNSDRTWVIISPKNINSYKTGTKKLVFSSGEWNSDINVNVSLKKAAKPTLSLSDKTIIFNTYLSDAKKSVKYGVEGSGISVDKLEIEGGNAKSQEALNYGLLSARSVSGDSLELGFAPSLKAGSYTLKLTGTIGDFDGAPYEMKSVNLTVKVVNQTPDKVVGISQKGNVNLVNRSGSDRLYTLSKLDQIGAGSIAGVSINGLMAEYFAAGLLANGEVDDNGYTVNSAAGAITVHAREGVALNHKTNYELLLKITLDNGYILEKPVKLKPVNSPAKLSPLIANISMVRKGADKICYIRSLGVGDENTLISSAELVPTDKNSTYFTAAPLTTADSKLYAVKLSINDDSMKAGTYTLRFNTYVKGQSEGATPVKVSVKVTVK